ncbi:two-component system, sensor histidine kinase YesM [Enterococcus sp. DIV2402]|uniref:histidine kinase n=1 Tax=Candidatus Enterococcus lowellii TaxID=2230877 RepID=A0ABZ2SPL1_9ENTE|nr:histidine kinase [Enterococcus sp. DIV2402]MBO0465700.1 histidine kinase [Enterococcus sp. DIV2402]
MKTKFKVFFQNLSFQRKIIVISFAASLFPLLLLTFFSIGTIQHFIIEREKSNNQDNLTATYQQINLRLTTYEEAIAFLTSSQFLIDELSIENPSNFEQYDLYTNTIVPLFRSIYSQQDTIANITLYTSINLYDHGKYVKKIVPGDITSKFKLNNTTNISYFFDNKQNQIYLYSQLFSAKNTDTNIIVFQLSPEVIFDNLDNISNEPYLLTITNAKKENLFQFSNEQPEQLGFISRLMQTLNQSQIKNQKQLKNDWIITFSRPMYSVYNGVLLLASVACLIFLFAIIMLSLSIIGLSKTVVAPIQKLANQMNDSPENTLNLKPTYQSNDEIGKLYQSFYQMIQQIQELINRVYKSEIKQQKHELRALQAQINPHFFYNSLSLINNKALLTGNQEISEMAQLLSQFYRLSLNNGKSRLSVAKELELTITYAKIQLKMHNHSFDLAIDVDEEIKQYEIITLLIQPFVENAIFHGIDHIEDDRRGKLTIRGKVLNNHLQFEISDNGRGMTAEQTATILTHQGKHYGIQNVKQRISLYYGVKEAIVYTSKLNVGTTVRIILPKYTT